MPGIGMVVAGEGVTQGPSRRGLIEGTLENSAHTHGFHSPPSCMCVDGGRPWEVPGGRARRVSGWAVSTWGWGGRCPLSTLAHPRTETLVSKS